MFSFHHHTTKKIRGHSLSFNFNVNNICSRRLSHFIKLTSSAKGGFVMKWQRLLMRACKTAAV